MLHNVMSRTLLTKTSPLFESVNSLRFTCVRTFASSSPRPRQTSLLSTTQPHYLSRVDDVVNIVEVGPRDGLQNEKGIIPPRVKVELINRLARAGMRTIEAGSFVSPKWVPQMAGTREVLEMMDKTPGIRYLVLVPNLRGLEDLISFLSRPESRGETDEIAVFAAATDAFSKANTNCTISESLKRLAAVSELASRAGLRVRGYVSVVITCPYSGRVDYNVVREVTRALFEMGCYEVSLGDTTGTGSPETIRDMLNTVIGSDHSVSVDSLAGHFHDTHGTAIANIFAALETGVRTFDSSVGGLGGCPYSPGATGNVATEDVVYALTDSGYNISGISSSQKQGSTPDLAALVDIGEWISKELGRGNASRAGRALLASKTRKGQHENTL